MSDYFDAGFEAIKADVMAVVTPIKTAVSGPEAPDPANPPKPESTARKVQEVAGGVGAALQLPLQLLNTGFALATSPIAALFPSFPAATLGSLYVGPPHAHMHPACLVPPAPPVPLPSLGMVMLGTSIRVLIEGKPAARAGDIGMAVTCCGLVPAFEIKTGSSNVFIGGMRAARQLDFCMECAPGSGAMNALGVAMMAIGVVGGVAGAIADSQDAAEATNPAMAAAKALSATMNAAQAALDAATMAIKATMGTDIAVPPSMGFVTAITASTVQIGGFPMINFPDPLHMLFEKLGKLKGGHEPDEEETVGGASCPV